MKKEMLVGITLVLALLLAPGDVSARWLNPETGRFWTMDTFDGNTSKPLSLHKYVYADSNPVNRIDPSGQFSGTMSEMLMVGFVMSIAIALSYQPVGTSYRQRAAFPTPLLDPDSLPGIRTQREPQPTPEPKKLPPGVNGIPDEDDESCPTLYISKTQSTIPNIAQHIDDAQNAGYPGRRPRPLHRGDGTRAFRTANRKAALAGLPHAPKDWSWDEYPFAATLEGGRGASTRLVPTNPIDEQSEQGGILNGFFTSQGVPAYGCFYVVITP